MTKQEDEDIVEILAIKGDKILAKRTQGDKTYIQTLQSAEMEHGKPLPTEHDLFTLEPRKGEKGRFDVNTFYEGKKGPARTNSPQFRQGWDDIFGNAKKPSKEMLN